MKYSLASTQLSSDARLAVPALSYSSSEDEDSFYDADNYDSDTNNENTNDKHILYTANTSSSNIPADQLHKSTDVVSDLMTSDQLVTQIPEGTVVSNTQNSNLDQTSLPR